MIFNNLLSQKLISHRTMTAFLTLALLFNLMHLTGCTDEAESDPLRQHSLAHQLNIVDIEMTPAEDFVVRVNSSRQFIVYGLLADGSRLMTEADENGEISEREINDLINWSVSDVGLATISNEGLLTSADGVGSIVVNASFSGLEKQVEVLVSDAELTEISIQGGTEVDVCRNLELTASGVLADGNSILIEPGTISWTATNIDPEVVIGRFNDQTVGTLSTFINGTVDIMATDTASEVGSEPVTIFVFNSLQSVILSNESEDQLEAGKSIPITATGQYADGFFDITGNATFVSRDTEIATFIDNILTAKSDVEDGVEAEISGLCNEVEDSALITISNP